MSKRRWYNDMARDIRDWNTIRRAFGNPQGGKGCSQAVTIVLILLVVGVVVFAVWLTRAANEAAVEATETSVVRTEVIKQQLINATAGTPIPTATIEPKLLIRYSNTIYDSSGHAREECLIKGNINSKGDKIYHLPGSSSYSATKIDESAGERWFCTEYDAIRAGWHAPGQ